MSDTGLYRQVRVKGDVMDMIEAEQLPRESYSDCVGRLLRELLSCRFPSGERAGPGGFESLGSVIAGRTNLPPG